MKRNFLSSIRKGASTLLAVLVATSVITVSMPAAFAAQGDTFDKNREVSKRFTSESIVLLKNNKNALPINSTDKIAVFGSTQVNTYMTVFGSGSTNGLGVGFVDTLSAMKTKIQVDSQLEALYRNFAQTNPPNTSTYYNDNELLSARSIPEMPLTDSVVSSAAVRDTEAVIFIGRTNGEGYDWQLKDEYQLRQEEKDMLDLVTKYFNKVTVVLNTASPIDMTWDNDKIDAILWVGICGDQGANAITSVMTGETNPSGKLTQTWAKKYTDTPTNMNYDMTNTPAGLHGPEVVYKEDIYSGYRYYDTFNVTPKFEFGFGLSYTNFSTNVISVTANNSQVTVKAIVENTGNVAGKEIVQVYFSAPDGILEKPYQQLAAFAKTNLLAPKEKQMLTITYNTKDMASYDEQNAQYILEKGNYIIRVGDSSRNTHIGFVLSLDNLAVTEKLSNQMGQAIQFNRFTKIGVTPYSYTGEVGEIANAPKIVLSAADIKTVDNKNLITDEPSELAGTTVETAFVNASKTVLNTISSNTIKTNSVTAQATNSTKSIPGQIYCADLGVDFAGFVVNNPSGDVEGYKSVTVQKANTQMPFDITTEYDGTYSVTLRYLTSTSGNNVVLRDQNNRTLGTFNLGTLNKWANATLTGIDLTGVTQIKIVTLADQITLNWLKFNSETYAGFITSNLPAGMYGQAISVALYDRDMSDATIHYTLDGSTPTSTSPTYTAPINITNTTSFKAAAVKQGFNNSSVATFTYTINAGTVTAKAVKPSVNYSGKDSIGNQLLSLSAQDGMSIFYTLDGVIPTSKSTYYTGPISAALGSTVRAVAIGAGYLYSDITEIHIAAVQSPSTSLESLGTYVKGASVSLTAGSGTSVYYTMSTDGTQPANPTTESNKYTASIVLSQTGKTIIKAVASNTASGMSDAVSYTYNVVDHLYTLDDVYQGKATVDQVVAQMTLSELVEVVSSSGKSSRFLSPSVSYADGPLGVKTNNFTKWASPSLLASSWDISLFAEQGNAVGKEMVEEGIDFWLAPGINIIRDPRSGRNPEYYSEDPILTGVLAASVIQNVQAHGVGCVIKHFVANDQETNRKQNADVVVSERALRETDLKAFEIVVKTAQPWGIMTTYCDANRKSTATNFDLCTAITRGEWGFKGLIMTDWGCYADNGMMVYAGNDIIMPSGNADVIKKAVLNPEQVNNNDPNYTKPTTKAMLQRNVVNIFNVMSHTNAFARLIGKSQTYQYQVPEIKWFTTSTSEATVSIEANSGANGGVDPAIQDVIKGTDASLTITPQNGYLVNNIIITPKNEYALTGNNLTIKNAEESSIVEISFKAIPTVADVSGLNTLIQQAQNKLNNAVLGGSVGNYLHSSSNAFTISIDAASVAAVKTTASVTEIETAILMLKQAINTFESQCVTVVTHEINSNAINKIKAIDYLNASPVIGSENCSDTDGGKNTTGFYSDTYLTYKLDVEKSGIYSLSGRISSNVANTGFMVSIDGEDRGTVAQKNATGGWQNWQTTDSLRVELTKGIHVMKIVSLKSGININWLSLEPRFKQVTATAGVNGTLTPVVQDVEQGTDMVIQIQPNAGYMVQDVTITPKTDFTLKNNVLTIHKIAAEIQVNVSFKLIPSSPDFAGLNSCINTAEGKLNNAVIGGLIGNYLPNVAKKFDDAITAAKTVFNNTSATATDVDDAIRELQNETVAFDSQVVTQKLFVISIDQVTKIKAVDHTSASAIIGSQNCDDTDGGQNPTYTGTNTWMTYDMAVLKDGIYNFTSRVSVNTAGSGFQLLIDDEPVGTIVQNTSTGGWQNWITNSPIQIPLSEGIHTFKILVTNDGINFNWFQMNFLYDINVQLVIDAITELPSVASVLLTDETAVNAANSSYGDLTTDQKKSVTNYGKVTDLLAELVILKKNATDLAVAQPVIDAITELPSLANVKITDETAVNAANSSYGDLTTDQKKSVTNYGKVTDLLAELVILKKNATDLAAAQPVIDAITELPSVTSVLLTDETAVNAANSSYGDLTTDQKKSVTNYGKVTDLLAELVILKKNATDTELAQAAIVAINLLPSVANVKLVDENAVNAVNASYGDLTTDQKKLVTNYGKVEELLDKLVILKKNATDLAASQAVIDAINALPSVANVILTDETAVNAVNSSYGTLTADQKTLVTNYTNIAPLKSKIATLKDQLAADTVVAKVVIDRINSLSSNITLSDKLAVEEIIVAYGSLTPVQKLLVTNYAVILNAQTTIKSLENTSSNTIPTVPVPNTGDNGIIPLFALIAGSFGSLVFIKKRKNKKNS